MFRPITASSIHTVDNGAAGAIIDAAIREAVRDLDDRGAEDGKPRKVSIVLELLRGEQGLVVAHVEAAAVLPKRRTGGHLAKVRLGKSNEPELFIQDADPTDPSQATFDDTPRREAQE